MMTAIMPDLIYNNSIFTLISKFSWLSRAYLFEWESTQNTSAAAVSCAALLCLRTPALLAATLSPSPALYSPGPRTTGAESGTASTSVMASPGMTMRGSNLISVISTKRKNLLIKDDH